jgi:DNA-binding Lrp family transcriptional regulator
MDRIDEKIMKTLMENPQCSCLTIAEEIGVAPSTVQRRFKKLKTNGRILKMTTLIDLSKIGFQGKAILFISGSTNFKVEDVMQDLTKTKNIFTTASVVGSCDLMALVAFREIADVERTIEKVKSFTGVKKVDVALSTDTSYPVKRDFYNIALKKNLL